MNLFLLLTLITAGGTFLASRVPNQEDMVSTFREGQRFYAEGAYDQAITKYEAVLRIRSRALDVEGIQVAVGDDEFPVQEAAHYQIGNSFSKLHAGFAQQAEEEGDEVGRARLQVQADEAFAATVDAFQQVIDGSTSEVLKVLAYGRLIDLYFKAGKFPQVIEAADALINAYPDHPQVIVGYYNTGWALYELGEYDRAISAFERLLARFPSGYQADRSLFQIGECYLETGRYARAIDSYRQLIIRQKIENLTEVELRRIRREKIAGLVNETALELAAKAQIRIGTSYARWGRYDEGLEAYRQAVTLFGSERKLVEEAYLRMADLHRERGDLDASIRTYREAIDQSSDRTLRARIQYALAESFFSQARYVESVREYETYLDGFADIANVAGFPEGRVRYRIGSAYQQLADEEESEARPGAGRQWLQLAVAQYDTLCMDETSSYFLDARFNRALAYQSLGSDDSVALAEAEYRAIIDEAENRSQAARALVQLGELYFDRGRYGEAAASARQLLDNHAASDYVDVAHMRLGLSQQAVADLDGAVAAFLAVPETSSLYARSRLGAGHSLVNTGRFDHAARVLEAGLAKAGEDVQRASFNYLLGQAYSGLNDYGTAVTHFTAALTYPIGADLEEALRFSRGNAAFVAGQYGLAEEDFNWIAGNVQEQGKIRSAKDALALVYLKQDRGSEAVKTLAAMAAEAGTPEEQAALLTRVMDLHYEDDNFAETIVVARQLIDLQFDDALAPGQKYGRAEKAYFLLGDALARMGRSAEAAKVFQEALRRFPASFFSTDMRLTLGVHYFDRGELERARKVFTDLAAADLGPDHRLMVGFYLANTHYSLRDFRDAWTMFEQLLRDYPQARALQDILFGLAESHYQLGEFEAAIPYYSRIVTRFPDDTTADNSQYNLAWCLLELKREAEAMAAFRTLLERYPQSEFAAAAQFTLADDAYNRGSYEEAMLAYKLVQDRFPEDPVAAQVPRLISEITEAIAYDHYERAVALMDSAEAVEEGAIRKQYFARAVSSFEDIRARYPDTESALGALSNMGVCLEGLGQWRDAVETYDRVIEMYEDKRASKEVFQFAKAHRDWIVSTRL